MIPHGLGKMPGKTRYTSVRLSKQLEENMVSVTGSSLVANLQP